mgnify:CR=1 FL=1
MLEVGKIRRQILLCKLLLLGLMMPLCNLSSPGSQPVPMMPYQAVRGDIPPVVLGNQSNQELIKFYQTLLNALERWREAQSVLPSQLHYCIEETQEEGYASFERFYYVTDPKVQEEILGKIQTQSPDDLNIAVVIGGGRHTLEQSLQVSRVKSPNLILAFDPALSPENLSPENSYTDELTLGALDNGTFTQFTWLSPDELISPPIGIIFPDKFDSNSQKFLEGRVAYVEIVSPAPQESTPLVFEALPTLAPNGTLVVYLPADHLSYSYSQFDLYNFPPLKNPTQISKEELSGLLRKYQQLFGNDYEVEINVIKGGVWGVPRVSDHFGPDRKTDVIEIRVTRNQ